MGHLLKARQYVGYPGDKGLVFLLQEATARWKDKETFFLPSSSKTKWPTETLQSILGIQTLKQRRQKKFSKKENLACRDSTYVNLGKVWHV